MNCFLTRSGVDNLTYPSQPSFTLSRNRVLLIVAQKLKTKCPIGWKMYVLIENKQAGLMLRKIAEIEILVLLFFFQPSRLVHLFLRCCAQVGSTCVPNLIILCIWMYSHTILQHPFQASCRINTVCFWDCNMKTTFCFLLFMSPKTIKKS